MASDFARVGERTDHDDRATAPREPWAVAHLLNVLGNRRRSGKHRRRSEALGPTRRAPRVEQVGQRGHVGWRFARTGEVNQGRPVHDIRLRRAPPTHQERSVGIGRGKSARPQVSRIQSSTVGSVSVRVVCRWKFGQIGGDE